MRRRGVVWMAVLAGVVLAGCGQPSGRSGGTPPTGRPVGVSPGGHEGMAVAEGESAAPASLEFVVGEAGADAAGPAYRSPASADDASGPASEPMPAAAEPADRPPTATTAGGW